MADAYDNTGVEAQEALNLAGEIKLIKGIKPKSFSKEQRETARFALVFGEQYLEGWIHSLAESAPAETALAVKHKKQIRDTRLEHFGKTLGEYLCDKAVAVDVRDIFDLMRDKPSS